MPESTEVASAPAVNEEEEMSLQEIAEAMDASQMQAQLDAAKENSESK
jgi:hypothetical protein